MIAASAIVSAEIAQRAPPAGRHDRPVEAERKRQAVDDGCLARGARDPLHPAHLEADEPAERRARVEIRTARPLEAAADFGEAKRDEQRREAGHDERRHAPGADLRGHARRRQENGAADDLVDADRRQIPAPQLAPERDAGRRSGGGCGHAAGCIMLGGAARGRVCASKSALGFRLWARSGF